MLLSHNNQHLNQNEVRVTVKVRWPDEIADEVAAGAAIFDSYESEVSKSLITRWSEKQVVSFFFVLTVFKQVYPKSLGLLYRPQHYEHLLVRVHRRIRHRNRHEELICD